MKDGKRVGKEMERRNGGGEGRWKKNKVKKR